jgi:hypothetical protein
MSNIAKFSDFNRNKENPFISEALQVINKNIVKKHKTATNTGESAVLTAIDENTGEILGHTTFIRQIEVDEEQFTKFYLSNFNAFFNLKSASIKVFGYILKQLQPNQDSFYFIIDECVEYTTYTKSTIYKGLAELLQNEIIAKGKTESHFFINPLVVFNGNRVTFARTYVKKKANKIDPNQLTLFPELQ